MLKPGDYVLVDEIKQPKQTTYRAHMSKKKWVSCWTLDYSNKHNDIKRAKFYERVMLKCLVLSATSTDITPTSKIIEITVLITETNSEDIPTGEPISFAINNFLGEMIGFKVLK